MITDTYVLNLKSLLILFGILFCSVHLCHGQSVDSVSALSCKTWGAPNWKKLEAEYLAKGASPDDAKKLKEFDPNIRALGPGRMLMDLYSEDIYLRWSIEDTTILYNLKIEAGERIVFDSTAATCGVKFHAGSLTMINRDRIAVTVERIEYSRRGTDNWGLRFELMPLSRKKRPEITNEIMELRESAVEYRGYLKVVDYFLKRKMTWDAIGVLEQAIEKYPRNSTIKSKYWSVINDLYIQR